MKMTRKIGIMAIALFTFGAMVHAQNSVSIIDKSGKITGFSLSNDGKLYFENDNLMIKKSASDAVQTYALANIKKIVFTELSGLNDVEMENIAIFPNPTTDNVYVAYAKEGDKAELYTWNGLLLATKSYSTDKGVSLSEYPIGLYILRINGQSFKISKK